MFLKKILERIKIFLKNQKNQISRWNRDFEIIEKTGMTLVVVSVLLVILIFYPVVREEIYYFFSSKNKLVKVKTQEEAEREKEEGHENIIVPVNEDFGIVIPKISANAKVIEEVDWENSDIYQKVLTEGVAHAKGTAFPGENKNIFIFAHSSADFWEANRYNAVFYLLSKMEIGDEIYLFYKKQKYLYKVFKQKVVSANEVKYLEKNAGNQLTLMTCWPPGTTLKRLIIIANPIF